MENQIKELKKKLQMPSVYLEPFVSLYNGDIVAEYPISKGRFVNIVS